MSSNDPPQVPIGSEPPRGAALQHEHWRKPWDLSSSLVKAEQFLESAGYDRGPWLVAGLAAGIAAWFALANLWQWLALIAAMLGIAMASAAWLRADGPTCWPRRRPR